MSGWNLPPGCTNDDIDRAMGYDGSRCATCGEFRPDCECEEFVEADDDGGVEPQEPEDDFDG